KDDLFKVTAFPLAHGIPSYGFRIEEADKLGELNVKALKNAGIKPGPIYKQIKSQESTILDDGSIINREDYIGTIKKGKIICILSDTTCDNEFKKHITNADVLVHEATFYRAREDLAYNYFHSTTRQGATLAKNDQVKHLILTHISARYQNNAQKDILEGVKS